MSHPQQPNWQDQSWPSGQQPQQYQDPSYQDPNYAAYPASPAAGYGQPPASPAAGYGVPPGSPAGYGAPYGYQPMVMMPSRPTNGMAVASMIVSLVGLFTCGVPGFVGAILGHVARKQIRERGEEGEGMALAGIIIGWICVAIWALIGLFYVGLFALIFGTAATVDPYEYNPTPYGT